MRSAAVVLLLAACVPEGPPREGDDPFECRDRADNDVDGLFDCDDADCAGSPDCAPGDDDDATDAPPEPDVERIFDDVAYLASDELEGRLPGTLGNDLATDHVADAFAAAGLLPAGDGDWFRAFDFTRWQPTGPPSLSVDGAPWTADDDYVLFRGSGDGDVAAEIVFVGYGLTVPPFDPAEYPRCPLPAAGFDEYADVDVDGKIVLLLRHGPRGDEDVQDHCPSSGDPFDGRPAGDTGVLWHFSYKLANAIDHGAAAMWMVPGYHLGATEAFGGFLRDDAFTPGVPSAYLHRDRLEAALPDLERWADAIDASDVPASRPTGVQGAISAATELSALTSRDVVGVLEGADPDRRDEVVLIGAHVDHLGREGGFEIFNGADDNASGTAVMLELARLLAAQPEPPARPVVFAAFNAEEMGLIGSCDYAADPSVAYPLASLHSMVSVDMVGGGDASGVEVYGGAGGPGQAVFRALRDAADARDLGLTVTPLESRGRSDHACFEQEGVAAALVTTAGEHPDYHQPSDVVEAISRDDLQAAADLLWAWLQDVARP